VADMQTKTLNFHLINQKIKGIEFNWLMFIFVSLFFGGLILGCLTVKNRDVFILNKMSEIYSTYLLNKNTYTPLQIFINTFLLSTSSVVVSFFIGLCALGVPFIMCLPFVSGGIIGAVSGYMYETYLLKGLGYCAIIIFPAATIILVAQISSCKESMMMSKDMLSILATGRNKQANRFKDYCIKHIVFTGVCASAALIEAVLFKLFSGLFIF
jgi:cytochrome c oxidase subunit IV